MEKKFEVRADVQMTMDFVVQAEDELDARMKIKDLLCYVEGGKPDTQAINVKMPKGDKFTNCFVMECQVDDVNEVE